MTLYVYYCVIIVYIDSLTSKTPLASLHKMLVRENSNEPSKTLLAELFLSVEELANCIKFVNMAPFFPFFSFCFVTFSSPAPLFFHSSGICLASHQATENLVAFFRREGYN